MSEENFPAEVQTTTGGAASESTVHGSVGNLIGGGTFHGLVQQASYSYHYYRDVIAAMSLDPAEVERRRATFVEPLEFGEARTALQSQSAVVLLGSPGCGRRTTGTVLLAMLGLTPKSVVLDEEDFGRQLEIAPTHGYLLDLDEGSEQLTSRAASWIGDLAVRLRGRQSCLVVRAREHSWRALGLNDVLPAVRLTQPPAVRVFRAHLTHMTSESLADSWARHEEVSEMLRTASPPDGVRLARIVAETSAMGPLGEHLNQVIAEYRNWADELAGWFRDSAGQIGAYRRALLLAAAALEGAPAGTVFAAADSLAKIVELPREPGGALAGPDASDLIGLIQAELQHDASIKFGRPAFGSSVLDHVWTQRPQLHADLRKWLISLAGSSDEGSWRAAKALTGLAIKKGEAGLVCLAARQWVTEQPNRRELAVEALTDAALSEEIGRDVRRQLYDWARATSAGEATHLVVAIVCAGRLAQQYPQMALTRLRHLVGRPNAVVQDAVIESLAILAGAPRLFPSVLGEVARWLNEESRRSAGLRAFLRLAAPSEAGQIAILSQDDADKSLLGELWRAALRDDETGGVAGAAGELASQWLYVAAHGQVEKQPVLEVLAGSCRSSIDVAVLASVAFGSIGSRDSDPARWDIGAELVRLTSERDPIMVGRRSSSGERLCT